MICCNKIHLEIQCWFVLTYVEVSPEGLYWCCISDILQLVIKNFIRYLKTKFAIIYFSPVHLIFYLIMVE